MTAQAFQSRTLIITAWIFLLLSSGLPQIIVQEVLGYEVSFNLSSVITALFAMKKKREAFFSPGEIRMPKRSLFPGLE